MLLKELANTSYDYELKKQINDEKHYIFLVTQKDEKELEYRVIIFFEDDDGELTKDSDATSMEVMFLVKSRASTKGVLNLSTATDKITGTGNAFKVFSTVLNIMKKELKEHPNISKIVFASEEKEKSRVKLYNHFVDNIEKYLLDWKLKKVNRKNTSFDYYLEKK